MRDFKNFTPSPKEKEQEKVEKEVKRDEKQFDTSSVEDMIKSREGRTEEELMSELKQTVASARREGRLSQAELENFQKTVQPFLSSEQTKRLEEILAVLE